jgi:hypothetical protein
MGGDATMLRIGSPKSRFTLSAIRHSIILGDLFLLLAAAYRSIAFCHKKKKKKKKD